jgi:hypothetical protein
LSEPSWPQAVANARHVVAADDQQSDIVRNLHTANCPEPTAAVIKMQMQGSAIFQGVQGFRQIRALSIELASSTLQLTDTAHAGAEQGERFHNFFSAVSLENGRAGL